MRIRTCKSRFRQLQVLFFLNEGIPISPPPPRGPRPEGQGPPRGGDLREDDGTLLQGFHGQDSGGEGQLIQGEEWIFDDVLFLTVHSFFNSVLF
jgi:hypothetical protein